MKTPIYDFVREYSSSESVRLHMPGHKGVGRLGCEALDITEICGADVLYSATGIIGESEDNASRLFGSGKTLYSTEGSTLAIKAMLALATKGKGEHPLLLAGRNAHKAFLYSAALLDFDIEWLYSKENGHVCSSGITADDVKEAVLSLERKPVAVYITSPDYLGNVLDVKSIAEVCDEFDIPLLVDNAHGAYLAFLEPSQHPISLGATMCADSAHKTLPVLTGGAYLHIAREKEELIKESEWAMSIFASTSPSYLTLESLDLCNQYLSDGYKDRLSAFIERVSLTKQSLKNMGYDVVDTEPLKIVISALERDYSGFELAEHLSTRGIELEFSDRDFAVMMLTPENGEGALLALERALFEFDSKDRCCKRKYIPAQTRPKTAISIRNAVFSKSETIPSDRALGRICATPTVSCPPAVPVIVSGEVVDASVIETLKYYGLSEISVVK